MNGRWRLASGLALVNLGLTAACLGIAGLALLAWSQHPPRTFDRPIFYLVWAYIVATPITGLLVLIAGDRRSWQVRANYAALGLWVLFVGWTATLTF